MAYPRYLRDKARCMRRERRLTLDEIAQRLALPRATVWYWIRDLPLDRPRRASVGQRKGVLAMQAKYRRLREQAYEQGFVEFDDLVLRRTFRDFVVLYIGEGSKRDRNRVAIGNSDPRVVCMAAGWLRTLSNHRITYAIQYHADQDLVKLRAEWGLILGIDGELISLQRKSNSGNLSGRTWRSPYGVLTVTVSDTLLRARLQAWIDRVQASWSLDSGSSNGA